MCVIYRTGTACAPSTRAVNTFALLQILEFRTVPICSPTAVTMSTRESASPMNELTCCTKWFYTSMSSTPKASARRASYGYRILFSKISSRVPFRNSAMLSQVQLRCELGVQKRFHAGMENR